MLMPIFAKLYLKAHEEENPMKKARPKDSPRKPKSKKGPKK